MEAKLILIGLAVTIVPPVCWYFIGKDRRFLRIILVVVWLFGLFLVYPVITFAWAVWNIEKQYDHNCARAIELSKLYMRVPYNSAQNEIIAKLVGGTPKYYYLTTIIACELKAENTRVALQWYEQLREYVETSYHDRHRFEPVSKKLDRLRERHELE